VTNKVLLMAGIAAVVVYVIGDLVSSLIYDGYSYIDQWISELTAFGSPVRPLMVTVILTHGVLLVAFGVGVLRASRRKSLSWVGGLLIAIGVSGLPTHTVWAMSSRGMETGFNDTMHASLSAVFSVLVIAAMAVSAVAYGGGSASTRSPRLPWWLGSEWHPLSRFRASKLTTRPGRAASSGSTPTPTSRGWSS
jgi:Protein of unknown function (DUF998)